jgi:hypothetical protein
MHVEIIYACTCESVSCTEQHNLRGSQQRDELVATRIAANPGVAAQPDTSLVTAAVRILECEADHYVVWRLVDRIVRFNEPEVPPAVAEAQPLAAAVGLVVVAIPEQKQLFDQLEVLQLPLRRAMHAVEARRAAGTLRATTLELSYFSAEGRLREHGQALLTQRRMDELRRETALSVALDLGARAMEAWRLWSSFSVRNCIVKQPGGEPDTITVLRGHAYEPLFAVAAAAVQLALGCAMADGAAPLRGSYQHAENMIEEWQHVEAVASSYAPMQNSASFRAIRTVLAEGGAAMAFLRATAATDPEEVQPRFLEKKLRGCDAPACAETEGMTGQFKKCASCARTWYCSKACQVAHWRAGHKRECGGAAAGGSAV